MPNMYVIRINKIKQKPCPIIFLLDLLLLQCEIIIFGDTYTKLHIAQVTISHFQSRIRAQSLEEPTGLATVTIWS